MAFCGPVAKPGIATGHQRFSDELKLLTCWSRVQIPPGPPFTFSFFKDLRFLHSTRYIPTSSTIGTGTNSRISTSGAGNSIRTPGGVPKIELTVINEKQMKISIAISKNPETRTRSRLNLSRSYSASAKTNNSLGVNTMIFGIKIINQSLRYMSEYKIAHIDPVIPMNR